MIQRVTKIVVLLSTIGLAIPAQAQAIPSACEQWFKAVEICTQSAINMYERVDIKTAKDLRQSFKVLQSARSKVRKAIVRIGEDAVAERCTKSEFINGMNNALSAVTVPLIFSNALDAKCQGSINSIVH
ncbi:hypothetical protein [Glaciimonas soli]|uniref:Uncharacterized protein n=1 Tax=Glaciimonas soli TaxID=2590999 RepID=A0A843YUC4_9BURK|nr:hypothetical protein [Glaciimonas soli]MQR00236.1 hypothetical protein [Glaciimonas soli]